DARITDIRTPTILRQHEPTVVSVVVESTAAGDATLHLEENNFLIHQQRVNLRAGPQTFDVAFEPLVSGFVRYTAEITMVGDQVPGNDRYIRLISVTGPPRILLVSRTPEEGLHLDQTLVAQGIAVEAPSMASLPTTLEGLLPYD